MLNISLHLPYVSSIVKSFLLGKKNSKSTHSLQIIQKCTYNSN